MISFSHEMLYLITGASSGIGAATALELNRLGATVIATARTVENLEAIKAQATNPNNFHLAPHDLFKLESLERWCKDLKNTYGKFSGFVHAAGHGCMRPVSDFNLEESRSLFDIHYYAPMLLAKAITDRRNNVGNGTSLVFISSISAIVPQPSLSMYASAKAAIACAAATLGKEVGTRGIRVNTISPALVKTDLTEQRNLTLGYDALSHENDMYPLGISTPEDIANLVVFLLSNTSQKITCQNIPIDGGRY